MKLLLIGGTFSAEQNPDGSFGRVSGLIHKLVPAIKNHAKFKVNNDTLDVYNGGDYECLQYLLEQTPNYDMVFWFANVENNNLPKIRDVKAIAPKTMLITSKRNDNEKYSFQELVQKALASKSNLVFEFSKTKSGIFNIMIFDPLGSSWYNGTNIDDAVNEALNRLYYLVSITRQSTIQAPDDKSLVLKWYFDQFKQDMFPSDKTVNIPDEQLFIDLVHKYAERFHELMNPACDVKRFLGNCSMKVESKSELKSESKSMPPQVGRCSKGMPSFKSGNYVFVSQRNVDKEYLDLNHFVPVYLENNQVYYCGNNKPSVDTPIQLRLYQALPNIRYMIHSHCYVKDAPFTHTSIPCGAIEEVDEVLHTIDSLYHDRNKTSYQLNLFGHGSLIMGNTIEELKDVTYIKRPMPEQML